MTLPPDILREAIDYADFYRMPQTIWKVFDPEQGAEQWHIFNHTTSLEGLFSSPVEVEKVVTIAPFPANGFRAYTWHFSSKAA